MIHYINKYLNLEFNKGIELQKNKYKDNILYYNTNDSEYDSLIQYNNIFYNYSSGYYIYKGQLINYSDLINKIILNNYNHILIHFNTVEESAYKSIYINNIEYKFQYFENNNKLKFISNNEIDKHIYFNKNNQINYIQLFVSNEYVYPMNQIHIKYINNYIYYTKFDIYLYSLIRFDFIYIINYKLYTL